MSSAIFRRGDRGPVVAEIRARLARLGLVEGSSHVRAEESLRSLMYSGETTGSAADGEPATWETTALVSADFDQEMEDAVRRFQRDRGISVDGLVGPETFRRLEEARWQLGDRVLSYQPGHMFAGDDVLQLQRQLTRMGFDCGKEDAHFGPLTDRGLREFQRNVGTPADGVAGPLTLRALGRLHRTVGKASAHTARERYALPRLQTGIAGKVVIIDVTPNNEAVAAPPAANSALALATAIARSASRSIAERGASVVRTESLDAVGGPLDELVRAEVCNDSDADLVVSLQIDTADRDAPGLAVYYYGRSEALFSAAGREAAEAICDALLAGGQRPCDTDARTWDILRATRMPSVRVCFGAAHDASVLQRLADPGYQASIATAIGDGLTAFFSPKPPPD